MSRVPFTTSRSRSTGSPPERGRPSTRRSATPGSGSTSGCSPLVSPSARSSANRAAPRASTTRWPNGTDPGSVRRSWARKVRPAGLAGRPGVAWVVGRRPAVPHSDVCADPPSAPFPGDGGRYDVPLPRCGARGGARGGTGGSRGSGRPHRRRPDHARAFLAAGLVDHLHVVVVPIVLGRGVRLWDGLEGFEEQYDVEVVSTPSGVTHLTFTR